MFRFNSKIVLQLVLVVFIGCASKAGDNEPKVDVLSVYTYQESFADTSGKITGTTIEYLRPILEASGLNYQFKVLPWSRLYRQAIEQQQTVITSLIRTPERENDFHWLLELPDEAKKLVTRNVEAMKNLTKAEIKDGTYRALCEKNSAQCTILREFGFPKDRIMHIYDMSEIEQARMVINGRVDFIVARLTTLGRELKEANMSPASLVSISKLPSRPSYLTAHKATDPKIVNALKLAVEAFKKSND